MTAIAGVIPVRARSGGARIGLHGCGALALVISCMGLSWTGLAAKAPPKPPLVRTEGGTVEGVTADGVTVFKGVPLGKPPIGKLRWADAQPAKGWSGVFKADRFAPVCMQPETPFVGSAPKSEDCLYLNLWTQSLGPVAKRAVLVQIYGGGFTAGSTSTPAMDGTILAKKGLVVVNLPYRVGTLGFLSHPELTRQSPHSASGGYAMSDLVLGLRWIRNNIARFGGDPDNVTVSGCSAGGHMTSYLIASPRAAGLFKRAIVQSGAQFTHGPENPNMGPLAENEQTGLKIQQRLGAKSLEDMREIPADKIVALQGMGGDGAPMAHPTVDGYYLPLDPYTATKTGKVNKVDLLTGWTAHEGVIFRQLWDRTTQSSWLGFAQRFAPGALERFLQFYPASDNATAKIAASTFTGDQLFGYQNYKLAEQNVHAGSRTWVYYFERPSKNLAMRQAAGDLPAGMLDGLHCGNSIYSTGNAERDLPLEGPPTDSDRSLADLLSSYWANFARRGDPNAPGLAAWPRYRGLAQPSVLRISESVRADLLPSLDRLRFLDQVFELRRVQGSPGKPAVRGAAAKG